MKSLNVIDLFPCEIYLIFEKGTQKIYYTIRLNDQVQGAKWQTNNFLNFLTSSSNYSEFQFMIRIMGITSKIEKKKHTQKQTIKQTNKQKDQQYTTSLVIKVFIKYIFIVLLPVIV